MMFATKQRVTATLLIVGFLVASLGMFAPPAYSYGCSFYTSWCCAAIETAHDTCDEHGSSHWMCDDAQSYAGWVCATAADVCGYSVYHLCDN